MTISGTGIYTITHRDSGRVYVGSTSNLQRRRRNHFSSPRSGKHCNPMLQRAWDKHGAVAFDFSVLLRCSVESLLLYEQRAIDVLKAQTDGFNIAPVAGCLRGFKIAGRKMPPQSPEARRNKCIAAKTRKKTLPNLSPEQRQKRAEIARATFAGRTFTPEHRAKLAAAKLGRKQSTEHRAAIARALTNHWSQK